MTALLFHAGCGGICGPGRATCASPAVASPVVAQQYPGHQSFEVDVAGNLIFVLENDPAGLQIYQRASDGQRGILKRGHAPVAGNAVAGASRRAFVATRGTDAALTVVDLKDLDHPVVVGEYRTPSEQSGSAIFAAPPFAYLGIEENPSGPELFILNVSDPGRPRRNP